MFTRNCPQCNAIIDYKHEHSRNKAETHKSRCVSCRNQRNLKPNCECTTCKQSLYRRPSRQKENVFCSYGCRNKHYTKENYPELFTRIKRDRSSDQKRIKYKKEKAVAHKGGKCQKCGYDKCIAALDFHHINPEEKICGVKDLMIRRWDLIKEEIDKCVLLCSNCHRELHWSERQRKKLDNTL
jgi:hypothetical protein